MDRLLLRVGTDIPIKWDFENLLATSTVKYFQVRVYPVNYVAIMVLT